MKTKMARRRLEAQEARDEIKQVIFSILNDENFWAAGICAPVSDILTTKQMDKIEIRLNKIIFPLYQKIQK